MYISYDDGANWKKFQLNLPEVPVTDLTIKENDLIVATQGRAFWSLDDLSIVQQVDAAIADKNLHVFTVNDSWRIPADPFAAYREIPKNAGANPPSGAVINYFVKNTSDTTKASIVVMDKNKKSIKTFSSDSKENKLEFTKGMNRFVWNLLYPETEKIDGMILWNGVPGNITAAPGNYFAKIKIGNDSAEAPFVVKADPNYKISQADYDAQFDFFNTGAGKIYRSTKRH